MATPVRLRLPRLQMDLAAALLFGWFLFQVAGAAGIPEKAYNLTWKSINFKTILEWEPKPINQVYTVQISAGLGDWKNKCFFTTNTECDLTEETGQDVHQTYQARVLSIPLENLNTTDYIEEPPHTNAPKFRPYLETNLGLPKIQSFEQVGTKLNVTVQDSRTLVRRDGTFLTLRDVFGSDLRYTLFYWKASSTGKKIANTNTNEFLIDVESGESYCFSVQATILSRKENQKSPESLVECTSLGKDIFHETFFIVGVVVFLVIIFIIVLSLSLYKCRKGKAKARSGKDGSPLNVV